MKKKIEQYKMTAPKFNTSPLDDLKTIDKLSKNNIAFKYVSGRGIPEKHYPNIYYVEKFQEWVNTIIPNKFPEKSMKYDSPRIVLPFRNEKKELIGFQGRSLNPDDNIRYITIKLIEDEEMIFGLDRVDLKRVVHVVEGPIDSLFIPNCVAGACASLPKFSDSILIWDNQPRNKDVCKQMNKSIKLGNKIFIWPSNIQEKDINELFMSLKSTGWDSYIKELINDNSHSGLMATVKFSEWRK